MQSSVLSSLSTSPSLARYSDREHSRPTQLSSIAATSSTSSTSTTGGNLDSPAVTHNDHVDAARKSLRNENPGKMPNQQFRSISSFLLFFHIPIVFYCIRIDRVSIDSIDSCPICHSCCHQSNTMFY